MLDGFGWDEEGNRGAGTPRKRWEGGRILNGYESEYGIGR